MAAPDDVSSYIALANPLAHPLHFLGLELVFSVCFALTIRDVRARYGRGERYALFQWLVIFAYGVAMELLAFNAFPDYEHGQFTAQLYHHKLPLYVTFVYVVFHYTGLRLVSRWRLGPLAEAVASGLAILLLDVPFDLAGAAAGWWTWHPSSHDVAQRWLGVPLTSYEWYLLFGAVLVWMCRAVRGRIERRSVGAYVALAPLVAVAIIVIGIIGFLPFHALEALGVPDGGIVAAHAAFAAVVAVRARWAGAQPRAPGELVAIPIALAGWNIGVIAVLWRTGDAAGGPARLAVATIASAAMLLLFVLGGEAAADAPGTSIVSSDAGPAGSPSR
jgi:hypothetical protein